MKPTLLVRVLVLSGITAFGNVASASDELAGVFLGAGTGAVIGNAIDRRGWRHRRRHSRCLYRRCDRG